MAHPQSQLDSAGVQGKTVALRDAFSPSGPIDRIDLFAGRAQQYQTALDAVFQPKQHAMIYGERGVGKTSLAAYLGNMLSEHDKVFPLRINCDASDGFSQIWRKALSRLEIKEEIQGVGFSGQPLENRYALSDALPPKRIKPEHVRRALQIIGSINPHTVIFLDEFDRVKNPNTRNQFADTIKTLSDHAVPVTLVLVGVADNVEELLTHHQSIERALVQIRMPRMSTEELRDIVKRGLKEVGMTYQTPALRRIANLSQGLPYYAHLLGLHSAKAALAAFRSEIELRDVTLAIDHAIDIAQQNISDTYFRATASNRTNIYKEVVLACALAKKSDFGYFVASDVREPLSQIMNKRYEIHEFVRHLNVLAQNRGPVLERMGDRRRYYYRFSNPLVQPYVIMKGLRSNLIDPEIMIGSDT